MLIFIDLETTGVEISDVICSLALLDESSVRYELFNEGKKIPALASSIHHITNEMIQDKKAFKESEAYAYLQKNNSIDNILIGHNVKFDLEKLDTAGLQWQGEFIDTLRVTKHMIKECEVFSLDFLRYELQLYKDELKLQQKYGIKDALCSNKALQDVVVIKMLFEYLLNDVSIQQMKDLSLQNVLLEKFPFGKYVGKYIEEIVLSDRAYIMWMLGLEDLDEDLRYSLEYYIRG